MKAYLAIEFAKSKLISQVLDAEERNVYVASGCNRCLSRQTCQRKHPFVQDWENQTSKEYFRKQVRKYTRLMSLIKLLIQTSKQFNQLLQQLLKGG